jgi:NAD dependent epimerase/dehydratase
MILKNKKVLVTGADGFIGSHLVEHLYNEGSKVKAFVYYNSFNSWGWLDTLTTDIKNNIEIISGDIRDPNSVRVALQGVDIVFHLAALIAIPYSYYAPDSYIDTNIKGTLNILQASREYDIEKILVTSTSEVYGTAQFVPITEQHPKQGQSPYSATKIGADHLAESFYRSFDLPVVIVRPFNTYGPRQSARAVIPSIIIQLLNDTSELKLGDLKPTRDLLFVHDTARGFLEIAKADNLIGTEINICTGTEISIGELAENIIKKMNREVKIVSEQDRLRPKDSEVFQLLGSNEKILKNTNWKQEYTLEKGLEKTIEWFKDPYNLSKYKSDIYNL